MEENINQTFDRNNFKEFVFETNSKGGFTCLNRHTNYKTFNYISYQDITDNYTKIGTLNDKKIPTLDYIYYTNQYGQFHDEQLPIATNFYPYHICDVYECNICKTLFVVYDDPIQNSYTTRIREVNPKLIIEEPSICVFRINKENLDEFISDLNLTKDEFKEQIEMNKNLEKYRDYYSKMYSMIVKKMHEFDNICNMLVITNRDKIYKLVDKYY